MNDTKRSDCEMIIATRESRLALWQARHVQALLAGHGHDVSLLGMTTKGDQILDRTLSKVGGKGLFVKELEQAMLERRAHLAVHSLKDVPMVLPQPFVLAAVLKREDARDVWVSNRYNTWQALPLGAVVGTSSLRRVALLRAMRPDLRLVPLRGNLDTRLKKLDDGQYDGIVLAAAGVIRLGLAARIAAYFEPDEMLPAAGQGAIGVEVLAERQDLIEATGALTDRPTLLAVSAERQVSRTLGASCSVPLAAHAHWDADRLVLRAIWADPDEAQQEMVQTPTALLRAQAQAVVCTVSDAEALGQQVAQQLVAQGAIARQDDGGH